MGGVSGPEGAQPTGQGREAMQGGRRLPGRIYRFGSFELRTETGELSKRGIRLRLQTKPLQALEALLERPGELISREELCARLWPGTYVDFESGLNTAINRLRGALGDSAESPRYIETLPRFGYRFLSPVELMEEADPVAMNHLPAAGPSATHGTPGTSSTPATQQTGSSGNLRRRILKPLPIATAIGIAALSVFSFGYFRPDRNSPPHEPKFHQLTFRSGKILNARFSPDPEAIVYTARWRPGERETYLLDLKDASSRILPFARGTLEAVSSRGDLLLASIGSPHTDSEAVLSRVSMAGGKPRIVLQQAEAADFDRNGRNLAIVRRNGPASLVEFPPGHVIYKSTGWINGLRIAPCGSIVAFLDHPISDDDAGYVRIARLNGTSRQMTSEWSSIDGLAWSPSGNEIWFTASKSGGTRGLYAVSEKAQLRRISNSPLSLRVLDVSQSGRTLISLDNYRVTMMADLPGDSAETDLSKFDFSFVEALSGDGKLVLFTEGGDGGGQHYTAFLYNQNSHRTARVGAGRGVALSADGKFALLIDPEDRSKLTLVTVGTGQSKLVAGNGFQYQWARFLDRNATALVVGGSYPGSPLIVAIQRIGNGKPVKLGNVPYVDHAAVSLGGSRLAGVTARGACVTVDLATGQLGKPIPQYPAVPIAWSSDRNSLFVLVLGRSPGDVLRVNVETGKSELWKSLGPKEVTGFVGLANAVAVPEIGAYAYSAAWDLSRLYVVDGLS